MERVFSRICECYICGKNELTNSALLPNGWITTWEYPTAVCDSCLDKWAKRWGEEPGYWLKGGEKEITLL